ncbi:MAG: thioredoxin domain-containing protein [Chloroflexi bacterium]|nr:thioredoxin domain-containing protein [Chloroflexota bacterium]
MPEQHTNALVHETSPYLLQHAHNPVDWHPWGPDALNKARAENKLIFLSIGYAACHWCHVMEHESFEDDEVAAILNEQFISIKVDREERPDLDEIYMSATMLYTGGHGGWPMSVFLSPDLKPVYAGTYFPKHDMHGRPGFKTLLNFISQAWREKGDEMTQQSERVVDAVREIHAGGTSGEPLTREQVSKAANRILQAYDSQLGGITSGSNKFPPSLSMDLLLREFANTGDHTYLSDVELTLETMGNGGIYDQLGGGIHRYSTDPKWLVPHFEKMLYDQGLVSSIYLDGYQAIKHADLKKLCEQKARGIFEYVLRDLRSPDGGFYSSEDADSEGLEGKFFIWTIEEIKDVLGERDGHLFASHYGVSAVGNWLHPGDAHVPHGPKNILNVVRSIETMAKLEQLSVDEITRVIEEGRKKLLEVREKRVRPGLDDKVLSGWNGLMITALAKGAAVLDEPSYGEAAARAAQFVLDTMVSDGRLLATYGRGKARLTAYITDYAFLIEGLLGLYEWSGDVRWLNGAARLTDTAIEFYGDESGGAFYFTASDHEDLLVRSKTATDGAIPSGNSVMLMNLQKLAILLDRTHYRDRAEKIIAAFADTADRTPFQHERLLAGIGAYHDGFQEIAIVGPPDDPRTQQLLRTVYNSYLPNKILARLAPDDTETPKQVPLLANRTLVVGAPAAYLCQNYVCQQPVTSPKDLRQQLTGIDT